MGLCEMGVLGRWLGDQEGLELGSLHPSLEAHNNLPLHLQEELTPRLGRHRHLRPRAPTYTGPILFLSSSQFPRNDRQHSSNHSNSIREGCSKGWRVCHSLYN